MNEYNVLIKEILAKTVSVDAEDADQAREIVVNRWYDGEYFLDDSHLKKVSFTTLPGLNRKQRRSIFDRRSQDNSLGDGL